MIKTKLVKVTPQKAEEWLEKNFNNRPISRRQVELYKRMLESGDFRTTHQGIAFDTKGKLRDGQHRLMAIAESGIAATMQVSEGLDEKDLQAIDEGRKRTAQDMLSMASRERVSLLTTAITKEMCVGGWHFADGVKRRQPTRTDLVQFYNRHSDAIEWASEALKNNTSGVSVGYVAAAMARALASETVSKRKMDQFAKTLTSGFGGDELELVIKLRNFLMRKLREGSRRVSTRDEVYAKVEQVVHCWANGEEMATIRAARTELFPLPGEPIPEPAAPPEEEAA